MANSCKECINMILHRSNENYRGSLNGIPREQIGEQCAIMLLHIDRDWLASFNFIRQLRYLKLFSALAIACKIPCQDPWNLSKWIDEKTIGGFSIVIPFPYHKITRSLIELKIDYNRCFIIH